MEAYGVDKILKAEAIDGFVVVQFQMAGGAPLHIALTLKQSSDLRPMLRDAEKPLRK